MSYILDSSAIIAGVEVEERAYTTPGVVEEIKQADLKLKLDLALEQGKLQVAIPGREAREKVERASQGTGDIAKLSRADRELLALALDFGGSAVVVTDDYSVQNLARVLGVRYRGIKERGIEKVFEWEKVCLGCRREYPLDYWGHCEVCGSWVVVRRRKRSSKH